MWIVSVDTMAPIKGDQNMSEDEIREQARQMFIEMLQNNQVDFLIEYEE